MALTLDSMLQRRLDTSKRRPGEVCCRVRAALLASTQSAEVAAIPQAVCLSKSGRGCWQTSVVQCLRCHWRTMQSQHGTIRSTYLRHIFMIHYVSKACCVASVS